MFKRLIALFIIVSFIFSYYQPVYAQDFSVNQLPVPGTMVGESVPFTPLALKGLFINPEKPLEFQFIVDTGHGPQDTVSVKDQANQLVKYFLAGLTIPEGDLWVNLSPYEKNRMVPEALGQTDLGRDLLAQDYILKQLTASLIYPDKDLGKEFWSRVYSKAQKQFGTTNVPVNTFNKVWILPDQAQVFEHGAAAYVTKATLKVMLDEDYLALQKHVAIRNGTDSIGSQIVREIIIPEITKEVNTGKNFAPLRQIYQALILAKWYKETIQNGLLDAVYTNKSKVAGVNLNDPAVKEQIYERYLKAYKKGAFNFIKEDPTPDGQVVPRKYFSGGFTEMGMVLKRDGAMSAVTAKGKTAVFTMDLDAAMSTNAVNIAKSWLDFVPNGIQTNPLWAQNSNYIKFLSHGLADSNTDPKATVEMAKRTLDDFNLSVEKNGVGLDLGFGRTGIEEVELASMVETFGLRQVHGIEWVGSRVKDVAKKLFDHGLSPSKFILHHADMNNSSQDIPDGSINLIYGVGLEGVGIFDIQDGLAKEFVRVLAPGGKIWLLGSKPTSSAVQILNQYGKIYRTSDKTSNFIFKKNDKAMLTSVTVNNTTIGIEQGDITQIHADGIVVPVNFEMAVGFGVTGAIIKALMPNFGGDPVKTIRSVFPQELSGTIDFNQTHVQSVQELKSKAGWKYVLEAIIHLNGVPPTPKNIREGTFNALLSADRLGIRSVTLPAFGTGNMGLEFKESAQEMMAAVKRFIEQRNNTKLENITFVLYGNDGIPAFQKELATLQTKDKKIEKTSTEAGLVKTGISNNENAREKKLKNKNWQKIEGDFDSLIEAATTQDELKRLYRRMAMEVHPDKNPGQEQIATEVFKRLAGRLQEKLEGTMDVKRPETDKPEDDFSWMDGWASVYGYYAKETDEIMGSAVRALTKRQKEQKIIRADTADLLGSLAEKLSYGELESLFNIATKEEFADFVKTKVRTTLDVERIWDMRPHLERLLTAWGLSVGEVIIIRQDKILKRGVIVKSLLDSNILQVITVEEPFGNIANFGSNIPSENLQLKPRDIVAPNFDFEREKIQTGWDINIGEQLEFEHEGKPIRATVVTAYFGGYQMVVDHQWQKKTDFYQGYGMSMGKWGATDEYKAGKIKKIKVALPAPGGVPNLSQKKLLDDGDRAMTTVLASRKSYETAIDVLEKSVLGRKLKSSSTKDTTTFVVLDNQTAAVRKFETNINWNLLVAISRQLLRRFLNEKGIQSEVVGTRDTIGVKLSSRLKVGFDGTAFMDFIYKEVLSKLTIDEQHLQPGASASIFMANEGYTGSQSIPTLHQGDKGYPLWYYEGGQGYLKSPGGSFIKIETLNEQLKKSGMDVFVHHSYGVLTIINTGFEEIRVTYNDRAMKTTPVVAKNSQDLGGIDLNQINVKRTGKTINIQFDSAQLNELEQSDFKGFTPVITGFRYIQSPFSLLLGINTTNQPERLAKV